MCSKGKSYAIRQNNKNCVIYDNVPAFQKDQSKRNEAWMNLSKPRMALRTVSSVRINLHCLKTISIEVFVTLLITYANQLIINNSKLMRPPLQGSVV